MTQPEFLTNDNDQTVADGITWLLNYQRQMLDEGTELAICTAYVNPGGFALVAGPLEDIDSVRLLIGADPDVSTSNVRRLTDQLSDLESAKINSALEGQRRTLEEDRNLLGFSYDADTNAKRFIKWLKTGKVKVRRFEKGFLHGKAWIISNPTSAVVAGSSNFTFAGLSSNKELNLAQYQPGVVSLVRKWYDDIWEESAEYDLASAFAARYEEHSPYLIYLRMLWERYRNEIDDENTGSNGGITLTGFQEDGVARARRILAKHRGVLIADGVGLGKSFIAAALMEEAIVERRQRVLLVAPAALRDGPWKSFQNRHANFSFECVSYEQLRDHLDPDKSVQHLMNPINDYAMVVVDEAHGFRNPDADRSAALRLLLQGSPSKYLVLLTATPVNNSIWDLYYELGYFLKSDSTFASSGIKSLREHFRMVSAKDPDDMTPKDLFDVLDEVAVRRTRHFIKNYYAGDTINVDGVKQTIEFPQPVVQRSDYDLDNVLPGFFTELESALDATLRNSDTFRIPDSKIGEALSLARYIPSSYLKSPTRKPNEVQISGLLLSGLLKRFESSSIAFSKTCERMAKAHGAFLEALDSGLVLHGDSLVEWMNTDTDDIDEYLNSGTEELSVESFNVPMLKRSVDADKKLLEKWAQLTRSISPEADPKLETLIETLADVATRARADSRDSEDEKNKRKTLIFSYYTDTAEWIFERLKAASESDPRLASYKNRIAMVSGDDSSRSHTVFGFAPISAESPTGEDLYDILVTTDVLAEGVNLQQARNIVNYDLPWNPMRLVQRHGRIDRIGSTHRRVYLTCFFPDQQLDRLLGLEHRLKFKLSAASAGVGVENEVLPGSATVDVNFAENRDEIEQLRLENPELFESGGEKGSALSGEEYRQDLRKGASNPQMLKLVRDLAWGSGSGKSANGGAPGYVFCAKIGNKSEPIFRLVSFQDVDAPEVIADTLACLAQAYTDESTERVLPEDVYMRAYGAWDMAKEDIYEKWELLTHPRNIQPKVPKAMRDAVEIIRNVPPSQLSQSAVERLVNSLESDYGMRIQRRLREAIQSSSIPQNQSNEIARVVSEIGLEPSAPPKPLPPITRDDIHLLCWIAIS
jgi:hypothetical protein